MSHLWGGEAHAFLWLLLFATSFTLNFFQEMIPYEQWNNNLRHFFSHKLSEEELTNVSQLNLELC
jgi:hypothetical protein